MTFENSYGAPTSSLMDSFSHIYRVNRAHIAEEVADEFEESLLRRIKWWETRAREAEARRAVKTVEVGDAA